MTSVPMVPAAAYAAFALLTFGYLLRNGRNTLSRRVLQGVISVGWPVYWLVIQNPKYTLALISDFLRSDEVFSLYWLAALFFPAFYVYSRWTVCTGPGPDCGLIVMGKAVLWAPFWPVFVLQSLLAS